MLQTLQAPPPMGSLQESVLILLLMKQESIEHARFRALAQITIDKEKGIEAFDEYMKVAFPYMEATKRRERAQYMELMSREIKRGPLGVTPIQMPTVRSKLKTRVVKKKEAATKREADSLYRKLGQSIPLR